MELYTIQMAKWRLAKSRSIPFVDTTVKTGTSIFAPTWDMVTAIKAGSITPEEYTERYTELMRSRLRANPEAWIAFFKQEIVTIACYCPAGVFCHRLVLVDIFRRYCSYYGIPFDYKGEIQ